MRPVARSAPPRTTLFRPRTEPSRRSRPHPSGLLRYTSSRCDPASFTYAPVAVAWVLANPASTSAIIGASRPDQLDATLAAAELALDPQLKARLDEVTAEYRRGDSPR
ncbi:aldo/keto reductase [Sorangium sp. So ce260]